MCAHIKTSPIKHCRCRYETAICTLKFKCIKCSVLFRTEWCYCTKEFLLKTVLSCWTPSALKTLPQKTKTLYISEGPRCLGVPSKNCAQENQSVMAPMYKTLLSTEAIRSPWGCYCNLGCMVDWDCLQTHVGSSLEGCPVFAGDGSESWGVCRHLVCFGCNCVGIHLQQTGLK